LGGTSKEASREADLSSSTPRAGFFLPEVRAMSRADGNAMIARGLGCGSNVLRIGRRPAPPDVEEVALTISGSFSPSLARASRIVNPRYP